MLAMVVDPWILIFSLVTVLVTVGMGFWSAKKSKTASDFFVAGRSVSVGWNASAISGEYLSAASFMGVAGMVMKNGYDALWYPVCYACGYLFLLLFIAGPLRRFGAYTIPDFAEGRYDSPVFRKIAVIFVLFIGFFYTMPQMKGAGTTLSYIFPGLDYKVGVIVVGAVITINVALGGMKGITLVQAVQYWIKMFAICVPVFVLMSVYGFYGSQISVNGPELPAKDKLLNVAPKDTDGPELLRRAEATHRVEKWQVYPERKALPEKAPRDDAWLNPFGSLTTKAVKTASAAITPDASQFKQVPTKPGVTPEEVGLFDLGKMDAKQALAIYGELTGRTLLPRDNPHQEKLDQKLDGQLTQWKDLAPLNLGLQSNAKKPTTGTEFKTLVDEAFGKLGLSFVPVEENFFRIVKTSEMEQYKAALTKQVQQEWFDNHQRPYSLLYTYSLIIALVCGTAGLPHILVRFYTNPDGVAAKRTTMWVMILIGVFYVFPPVFGVLGRNLLPELYSAVGAKGTDKVVLELPSLLNQKYPGLGSILSGITCAGAFAAFMSTFSGLLVSMTGALAHDVYGRILKPQSTAEQRLKAFKVCAVIIGIIAILLGTQVEKFDINFMVGQAFAIAAASYFPLLFLSTWWRGMTMKGAACGMLGGGLLALGGISLTSFSDLKLLPLEHYWQANPLIRILCEQPAIWAVPLAIGLMIIISKLTSKDVPKDIRMKMLVLHAPEKLGLKQEYIQDQQMH
nr:cation acetate symporter [Pedosphaera parvula]